MCVCGGGGGGVIRVLTKYGQKKLIYYFHILIFGSHNDLCRTRAKHEHIPKRTWGFIKKTKSNKISRLYLSIFQT